MTTAKAIEILKAALVALEAGNVTAARQLISQVIAGLQVAKHK